MTFDEIKVVIDDAATHNVYILILSGGDPLLHPQFKEVLTYARSKRLLVLPAITGVQLTDEDRESLRDAGVPTVQVSLDGPELTHDRYRGAGTFAKILTNIQRLQSAAIGVNVAICLHRGNTGEFEEFLSQMLASKARRIKLAFYRSFDKVSCSYEVLSGNEKFAALAVARNFQREHVLQGWIECPSHDIDSGRELRHVRRHPQIVVGADGVISAGEGGPVLGDLRLELPSTAYARHAEGKIIAHLDRTIEEKRKELLVSRIEVIDSQMHPDAAVFQHGNRREILVKRGLPVPWHYFTVLHELGHLATNTLVKDPASDAYAENEALANEWALETLRQNLEPSVWMEYSSANRSGYTALRSRVEAGLFRDFVRYDNT